MGLDMYLYAEKYISQYDYETVNGEHTRRDNLEFDKANSLVRGLPTPEFGGITISKCVAYWRKANAIHGWIVRNLADGVDECQRISITRDDLKELREACLVALKDRDKATPNDPKNDTIELNGSNLSDMEVAQQITDMFKAQMRNRSANSTATDDNPIPPVAGFFFGGTDKDEWYYDSLANTAETINVILASDPKEEYEYWYRASW